MTLKFQSKDEARAWDLYAAARLAQQSFDTHQHANAAIHASYFADALLEERRNRMPENGECPLTYHCYACNYELPVDDGDVWVKAFHAPGCRALNGIGEARK